MTQAKSKIEVVLGTGSIGSQDDPLVKNFYTVPAAQACLDLFRSYGFTHLDTARLYSPECPGSCEPLLGQTNAKEWATIDSKVHASPTLHRERILKEVNTSIELLGIPKANIYYLHNPDRQTPLEEQCKAMNDAHQAGKFSNFGVSNLAPSEVEQMVHICRRENWIVPSVYQGHYNAVARGAEEELLPLLRKHNMKYYAWSPAAGGLFCGTHTGDPATRKQGARWAQQGRVGNIHRRFYDRSAVVEAAFALSEGAEKAGLRGHEVALRWILHHSALSGQRGDAIVVGGSSLEQIDDNLKACLAGPLPAALVELVESVWNIAKKDPPPSWV
ncbi:hypothetical protein E8E14_003031 [Neopestalotiopsis sp. 37M]|nr:hypothetical protein E8E14_003031 [Neopestalotiopsis sp. 37M]